MVPRRKSRPYVTMVLAAFAIRVAVILLHHTYRFPLLVDSGPVVHADAHFGFGNEIGSIARFIATGHGFSGPFGAAGGPTAWIAPVYPYLAAAVFKVFGVFTDASAIVLLSLNSLFAALTCIPIYLTGEHLFGRRTATLAGWAWAMSSFFLRWPTTYVWEMSLCALLLACAFLFTLRLDKSSSTARWASYGLLWALMALTNPVLLGMLPAALGWLAWRRWLGGEQVWRPLIVTLALLIVGISPWLVRNRVVFGQWVFVRTNFAFEFRLGNYAGSNGMGWYGRHPSSNKNERDEYLRVGELNYVAAKRAEDIAFLRQHPEEFADLTATRIWAFWSGTPLRYMGNEPWKPWMYWPLSLLAWGGVTLMLARRITGRGLLAGLFLLYPLPFYITFAQVRNRHPLEPELLLVSSFLVCHVGDRLRLAYETRAMARAKAESDVETVHA